MVVRRLARRVRRSPGSATATLGDVIDVMAAHAIDLVEHLGSENNAMRDFRKHTAWYLTGYPVGPEARRRLAMVSSLVELDDLLAALDRDLVVVAGGDSIRRGHTNGPIRVALPDGFFDDELAVPDDADVLTLSGG